MSDDVVIRVEGLGKKYRLGAGRANERYTALRDVITDKAKSLFHRPNNRITDNGSLASSREFWALRDISFKVKRGLWLGDGSESEVVASCQEGDTARRGIIGRNSDSGSRVGGAGKFASIHCLFCRVS